MPMSFEDFRLRNAHQVLADVQPPLPRSGPSEESSSAVILLGACIRSISGTGSCRGWEAHQQHRSRTKHQHECRNVVEKSGGGGVFSGYVTGNICLLAWEVRVNASAARALPSCLRVFLSTAFAASLWVQPPN